MNSSELGGQMLVRLIALALLIPVLAGRTPSDEGRLLLAEGTERGEQVLDSGAPERGWCSARNVRGETPGPRAAGASATRDRAIGGIAFPSVRVVP